jgi:hypothetical protein
MGRKLTTLKRPPVIAITIAVLLSGCEPDPVCKPTQDFGYRDKVVMIKPFLVTERKRVQRFTCSDGHDRWEDPL